MWDIFVSKDATKDLRRKKQLSTIVSPHLLHATATMQGGDKSRLIVVPKENKNNFASSQL